VDVFVIDKDFEKAKSILENLCNQYKFRCKYYKPKGLKSKPKIEVWIAEKEKMEERIQ